MGKLLMQTMREGLIPLSLATSRLKPVCYERIEEFHLRKAIVACHEVMSFVDA